MILKFIILLNFKPCLFLFQHKQERHWRCEEISSDDGVMEYGWLAGDNGCQWLLHQSVELSHGESGPHPQGKGISLNNFTNTVLDGIGENYTLRIMDFIYIE